MSKSVQCDIKKEPLHRSTIYNYLNRYSDSAALAICPGIPISVPTFKERGPVAVLYTPEPRATHTPLPRLLHQWKKQQSDIWRAPTNYPSPAVARQEKGCMGCTSKNFWHHPRWTLHLSQRRPILQPTGPTNGWPTQPRRKSLSNCEKQKWCLEVGPKLTYIGRAMDTENKRWYAKIQICPNSSYKQALTANTAADEWIPLYSLK